ncbi:MAG: hypothetical protein IPL46_07410 [Saprospiraceae bacterium]|nr:hypothetical protein [Saprospiraceae bacterium]
MNRTHSSSAYDHWLRRLLGSLILLSYSVLSFGQQENPFELKNRIRPKKETADSLVPQSSPVSRVNLPDTLSLGLERDSLEKQQTVFDLTQTIGRVDTNKPIVNNLPPDTIRSDTATPLVIPDTILVEATQSTHTFTPTKNSDKPTKSPPGLVTKLNQLPLPNQHEVDNGNVLFGISILSLLLLASCWQSIVQL